MAGRCLANDPTNILKVIRTTGAIRRAGVRLRVNKQVPRYEQTRFQIKLFRYKLTVYII